MTTTALRVVGFKKSRGGAFISKNLLVIIFCGTRFSICNTTIMAPINEQIYTSNFKGRVAEILNLKPY